MIASLALISLTVGAIAPVPRSADAAVVTKVPQRVVAPLATLRDTPSAAPMNRAAYPDSGERGVMSKSTSYRKTEHTSMTQSVTQSMTQSMSESNQTDVNQTQTTGEAAISAIARAGAEYGLHVASSVLRSLGQDPNTTGGRGPKGDRPKEPAR